MQRKIQKYVFDRILSSIAMARDDLAFNSGTVDDLFDQFATKHGLRPGFQGDYDLQPLFGDLVNDQCFVRDRVSNLLYDHKYA